MQSSAKTVPALIAALPADRRAVITAVRKVILANLPTGYVESVNYGMIVYEIPLSRYPDTYNGQPLTYAGLAAQKHYYSLYMMCVFGNPEREAWMRQAFAEAGKKLDMGKSCIRFKKLEDLPLSVVGESIATLSAEEFIAGYERVKSDPTGRRAKKSNSADVPKPRASRRKTGK